jgi:hypothetical protein
LHFGALHNYEYAGSGPQVAAEGSHMGRVLQNSNPLPPTAANRDFGRLFLVALEMLKLELLAKKFDD